MSPKRQSAKAKKPARHKTRFGALESRVVLPPLLYPVSRPTPRLRNGPPGNTPDELQTLINEDEEIGDEIKGCETNDDEIQGNTYAMPSSVTKRPVGRPRKRAAVTKKAESKANLLTGNVASAMGLTAALESMYEPCS